MKGSTAPPTPEKGHVTAVNYGCHGKKHSAHSCMEAYCWSNRIFIVFDIKFEHTKLSLLEGDGRRTDSFRSTQGTKQMVVISCEDDFRM